jgi:hypothetical protein
VLRSHSLHAPALLPIFAHTLTPAVTPPTNTNTLLTKTTKTADGPKWQDTLQEVVGRRSVPQVFIGGAHVGGCDGARCARARCCVFGGNGGAGGLYSPALLGCCAAVVVVQAWAILTPALTTANACSPSTTPTDTMAAYQAGKLKELLAGVGYSI